MTLSFAIMKMVSDLRTITSIVGFIPTKGAGDGIA
jgi:hypothetical protein